MLCNFFVLISKFLIKIGKKSKILAKLKDQYLPPIYFFQMPRGFAIKCLSIIVKNALEKYAPGPEILSKTSQKSGRQTKPA